MKYYRSKMRGIPAFPSVWKPSPVPACTHLFVLEPHENHLFHQCQLGLFAPFGALANVSRVECDLVAIGRVLV